jgi:serine/threonine protein kinase
LFRLLRYTTHSYNPAVQSPDDIFLEAREISDPIRQAAYLTQACGGDVALRERIEGMLRDAQGAEAFFGKQGTLVAVPLTEKAGSVIGRYKLLQKIGEGGMGVVYMAEQREPVVRKVALKIIKLGMDTKQVVARFEAERQALALMDHPNIARVLDAGTTDTGRPYFVMDLVQGLPITRFCDEVNLSMEQRLDLFLDVCSAVQHAHQKGIIHRDLKPSNILVTLHADEPMPKVIDFGVAKATQGRLTEKTLFTQFQQFIGTPAYMSPEQASLSALEVDTRSDIYALGVLLYELLTGKTPFDPRILLNAGLDEMRRTLREEEPPRPSARLSTLQGDELTTTAKHRHTVPPKLVHLVRGDLDWIVMKCLEKDPARRYETTNGLAMDLQRHLANEPIVARPPSTAYRVQKAIRRNKLAFISATIIAAFLVLASVISTWQAVRATRAERIARAQTETSRRLQTSLDDERDMQRDLWLARGYVSEQQTNEAANLLNKLYPRLAKALPQHRDDYFSAARSLVRLGRYDDARSAYEPIRVALDQKAPAAVEDFQDLIEATAGSKGWPAAAEVCRRHLEVLPGEPKAWRTKAITLLYVGDSEAYRKSAAAANSLVSAATNWEDLVAILETASLATNSFSAEQTNLLTQATERILKYPTKDREERTRVAVAGVLLRLGRLDDCIKNTRIVVSWKRDPSDTALAFALGALCQFRRGNSELACGNFVLGDPYIGFPPLWHVEAPGGRESFLTEPQRSYLILRREEQATIPGTRVESLARQNRLKEAAAEAALAIQRDPTNAWHYHSLAPILAAEQNLDAYRSLCQKITTQFRGTTNSIVADYMAKACLVLPASGADSTSLSNLVHTLDLRSVYAWFTRGLAEYRLGHFRAATNWTQQAIDYAGSYGGNYAYVEARMVAAMAHHQLGRTNEARLMFAEGVRLADAESKELTPGDLGYDWRAIFRGQALSEEARALIER